MLRRDVRPVRVPLGALIDPSTQELDLFLSERVPGIRRRHVLVGIGVGDALNEQAVGRLAGNDHVFPGKRAVLGIEVEFRFAVLFVGPVAREAIVRENRADVPVEAEGRRSSSLRLGRGLAPDGEAHSHHGSRSQQPSRPEHCACAIAKHQGGQTPQETAGDWSARWT